jgi:hypothetical protein
MGTTRSAKSKGRLGQQEVRSKLLKSFPELQPDDVKSQIMGVNGEDIVLSPWAREYIPLSIEVKRRASFKTLYNFIEQAQSNKYEPVVFLRGDRQPWLTVCNSDHYINLLRKSHAKK